MPEAVLIAGPNGAGKTTFARSMIARLLPGVDFLNADEIQRESPELAHPVAAGKEFLRRLDRLVALGRPFVIETTLSSPMYAGRIPAWQRSRYRVTLHFIELPSADLAIRRVAARVAAGGHGIPEADIRRRFRRGLDMFPHRFKPLVDEWYHWISDTEGLRLVQFDVRTTPDQT
jgi:predicted ABC-type ATPase